MSSIFCFNSTTIGNPNAFSDDILRNRIAITDVVNNSRTLADLGEYSQLQHLFTEEVTVDYTSLYEGEVQKFPIQQLVNQWQSTLPGFDATQHQITIHQITIDSDEAKAISHVRATHRLGNEIWVVGGYYVDELVRTDKGWKVKSIQYNSLYEEGNRALIKQATANVVNQTNTKN